MGRIVCPLKNIEIKSRSISVKLIPDDVTEKDLRFSEGYYHIYDYGSSKWEWTKLA